MPRKSAPKKRVYKNFARKAKSSSKQMTAKKVAKIAKSVVTGASERKFMDSNQLSSLIPKPIRMIQRNGVWVPDSRVSVLAFSNTVIMSVMV